MSLGTSDSAEGTGLIFNIQRFSIQDGPGIRTTVFFKGCPLRCPWCSNPESLRAHPEIITRDVKCITSGRCVEVCPRRAIAFHEDARVIDWTLCDQCTNCAAVCRAHAIEVTGKSLSVAEVVQIVGRDASYYRRTGGGITLSGGEPLLQWRFALETLKGAKETGWHTTLDTAGYADWEVIEALLPYTDLVLYDVKHMNPLRHREATGKGNERILRNLQKLVATPRVKVWVRRTVIPQFNDDEKDVEELVRFVLTLGQAVEKISLLPYHKFGEAKYAALGRPYPYHGVPLVSDEQIRTFRELIEGRGINVDVGR